MERSRGNCAALPDPAAFCHSGAREGWRGRQERTLRSRVGTMPVNRCIPSLLLPHIAGLSRQSSIARPIAVGVPIEKVSVR